MIDSLFIISSSGNYVVERHFKGTIPRMVCEPFMEKLRGSDRIEEIPGMICSNRRHALLHILRENMVLLAVVTQEESPLVIFELLDRVHQVLQRYLGEVNEDTLRANFSTVYLLLSEMIDSGLPSTMELNSLESIIAPPSAIGKVVQAVSGSRSQVLSDVPPEANGQSSTLDAITTALGAGTHTQIGGASAEVWWRRQNVVYASNEIYVDIVEWVDCIVNEAGHIVSGGINGEIQVNSKLSGIPEVRLTLRDPDMVRNVSFHPCVRLQRYERDNALSFIPPDGEFALASYWIPDTSLSLPFYFQVSLRYHAEHGRLKISTNPKLAMQMQHKQMLIDKFCVNVRLPNSIASATLSCRGGNIRFDEDTKVVVWHIGKLVVMDDEHSAEATLHYSTDPKDGTPRIPTEEQSTAQLAFVIKGWAISGVRLDACELSGVNYNPYRASRYTTTSGKMEWRIA